MKICADDLILSVREFVEYIRKMIVENGERWQRENIIPLYYRDTEAGSEEVNLACAELPYCVDEKGGLLFRGSDAFPIFREREDYSGISAQYYRVSRTGVYYLNVSGLLFLRLFVDSCG